jgi:hypothetical protein
VTPEEMETQITSLREQVLQIQEQQERARKDQVRWSWISGAVGGGFMMLAGLAAIFLPPGPLKPVLLLLALFALFQSRVWDSLRVER